MRSLHLYTGLLLAPFVVVFAVSTLLLNHAWVPWVATTPPRVRTVPLHGQLPEGLDPLSTAGWVADQAGVAGEIQSFPKRDGDVLTVSLALPGAAITVRADLGAGRVTIERRAASLWDRLILLHRSPGPHLAGFRGNWVFLRAWRLLVDGSVAALLCAGVSGVYLWLLVRSQRRVGLVCATAGLASLALLVAALSA